ncbi:Na+/H+ antiporter subunit E [Micromonospora sp. CPCC 205561]|uniref:Na+/H+ antiporter subunit E n=1 Tax=Micromonospora sp. CPCC 205561 TaxID=3122407 RepID=UPI002FF28D22
MSRPEPAAPERRQSRRDRAIAFGWLVLVWCLLWGDLSWGNLVAGTAVAGAVLLFFPLPPVSFGGHVRPGPLLVFALRFVGELVSASAHVAVVAVRLGYQPRGAILAVRLRVRTDLNLALTAEAISLVPGTLIIEVDRDAGVLYVHVFDVRGPRDLTGSRERILAVERRLVRAVGAAEEVRRVTTDPVERGPDQ